MDASVTELYVTGLRNAHAIESMATEMLERQIERVESYPEMSTLLRTHLEETKQQAVRLEGILQAHGSSTATLKETWMSLTGNMAAMFHTVMQDEVMKNHFANAAVEAFETTMYISLIAMAQQAGDAAALGPLQQSLAEEQKTEKLIQDMTPALTQKYIARAAAGEKAGI